MTFLHSGSCFQDIRTNALILCVDDDATVLDVIQATLERKKFSVITALDWRNAMDVFRSHPIDLVILDYEMPELKGHELATLMRSANSEVPLILHSGSMAIPDAAMRATDAFIPKGSETCILIAAINNLLTKNISPLSAYEPSVKYPN